MGNFFKHIFHLILYVVVFFGVVWVLLGMPPDETYIRAKENLGQLGDKISSFTGKVGNTASNMKKAGKGQLQTASERIAGKDAQEDNLKRFEQLAKNKK